MSKIASGGAEAIGRLLADAPSHLPGGVTEELQALKARLESADGRDVAAKLSEAESAEGSQPRDDAPTFLKANQAAGSSKASKGRAPEEKPQPPKAQQPPPDPEQELADALAEQALGKGSQKLRGILGLAEKGSRPTPGAEAIEATYLY